MACVYVSGSVQPLPTWKLTPITSKPSSLALSSNSRLLFNVAPNFTLSLHTAFESSVAMRRTNLQNIALYVHMLVKRVHDSAIKDDDSLGIVMAPRHLHELHFAVERHHLHPVGRGVFDLRHLLAGVRVDDPGRLHAHRLHELNLRLRSQRSG